VPSRDSAELAALRERVESLQWFHKIDFGDGIISPGVADLALLRAQADIYFEGGIEGKSVLDIGCWDGFNSIEAVRRGAGRVLATDHWVWAHHPWANRSTIELAREHLAPGLQIMDIDVPDLSPERVGRFDIVLFCGVFYHLRHPFQVLESVARVVSETLIVETAMDAADVPRPAMIFYPADELNGDGSNWWGPNRACVEAMLRDVGFPDVRFTPHPIAPDCGIFRARCSAATRTNAKAEEAAVASTSIPARDSFSPRRSVPKLLRWRLPGRG
jgi:tRNA (mo5U34)-methyltransferase